MEFTVGSVIEGGGAYREEKGKETNIVFEITKILLGVKNKRVSMYNFFW